jgi:hypothetical protein
MVRQSPPGAVRGGSLEIEEEFFRLPLRDELIDCRLTSVRDQSKEVFRSPHTTA